MTTAFAAGALILILFAGWLLDRRAGTAGEAELADWVREASDHPATEIAAAVRANRMVFLSDIHGSAATKQLAARALEEIIRTSGLDVLVLEVGADQQPVIDAYLQSDPEDASLLVSNPRTIREPGPATRDYLEIYRTVWRLNKDLGADQRISILAADLEGWPPARPLSPAELARRSAERAAFMRERVQSVLNRQPGARMLFFMSGFHGLRNVQGLVQSGGSAPVRITWLGDLLAREAPEEVYTFLVDAPIHGASTDATSYIGTRVATILHRNGINRTLAVRINDRFDVVGEPLLINKTPGINFELEPRDYSLSRVADGYILLR